MKTRARMANPIRASGMPTKTARCTAMITTRLILMDMGTLMTMTTITPTIIHMTTRMGMITAILMTPNTL
jgi:hypothetical protein